MRRKIAKRLRRQCLKEGVEIIKEEFDREPGWKRKDCGYVAKVKYRGWTITSCGEDMLSAWKFIMDDIREWDLGDWREKAT